MRSFADAFLLNPNKKRKKHKRSVCMPSERKKTKYSQSFHFQHCDKPQRKKNYHFVGRIRANNDFMQFLWKLFIKFPDSGIVQMCLYVIRLSWAQWMSFWMLHTLAEMRWSRHSDDDHLLTTNKNEKLNRRTEQLVCSSFEHFHQKTVVRQSSNLKNTHFREIHFTIYYQNIVVCFICYNSNSSNTAVCISSLFSCVSRLHSSTFFFSSLSS